MYARIARFEGLDGSRMDEQVEEMKQQISEGRTGELPPGAPEEVRTLMETVIRVVQLGDRENGRALGVVFCATEEDMRRADAALNEMSPGEGAGSRTSVEIYEVMLDEAFA